MKKTLFFLFIFISANAQNKRTINLEIAGTLFSKINTEINNISDITLTGNINNEDIIVLRNMVQNGSLEYVDMFDSYIHGEGDEDNVIPEEAFKNCTNLKSIILPQKTLALGYESFYMCTNLSDITLPEQITTFSGSVFWGCEKLNKIDIPNSVTWIGPYSFYGCIGINKLTIKSKCAILKHSFDNCKNLQEIIFPESMDYIESDAFRGCHIDNKIVQEFHFQSKMTHLMNEPKLNANYLFLMECIINMPGNQNIGVNSKTLRNITKTLLTTNVFPLIM